MAKCYITPSSLLNILQGVSIASLAPDDHVAAVSRWLSSCQCDSTTNQADAALLLLDWHAHIKSELPNNGSQEVAKLTLAVGFLHESAQRAQAATIEELALVWSLIHGALTSTSVERPLCAASRSAQGFLAVPLCSLLKDGNIDQLFRLHVWLPDGQRGNPDFAVHSHQSFAQSWILAGEGVDHSYKVEPTTDDAIATHAEYALVWGDKKGRDTDYKTHQTHSTVTNTRKLMHVAQTASTAHTRGMTYTIPNNTFHTTKVTPNTMHATLFVFDSRRGFTKTAQVLGPVEGESFTQFRDPAGVSPATLANTVELLRTWETYMDQGRKLAKSSNLELSLRALNYALNLCDSSADFPNPTWHKHLVRGELGNLNRRFGRYQQARDVLEHAIAEVEPGSQRVEMSGELGVVYRHMNLLVDAKHAFTMQYDTAKDLGLEIPMCRAVGNLGTVNYQLSQQTRDNQQLELAIDQLEERVNIARRIRQAINNEYAILNAGGPPDTGRPNYGATLESIGLSRLSLCYVAQGNVKQAVAVASEALEVASTLTDATLTAFSRLFYGRALLQDGHRDAALRQFNPPPPSCTPAMALCKEPSDENHEYLSELVDAGANMELVDDQGYTSLDYAIFNGDVRAEELVLEGLRRNLRDEPNAENKLRKHVADSKLRKWYRELFQEKMRPILLGSRDSDGLRKLRCVYADALAPYNEESNIFDRLRFMMFPDFLRHGELPRSNVGLAEWFESGSRTDASCVIFFSYRWINHDDKDGDSPDDYAKTQYQRMIAAVEEFLTLHPDVDREMLGIWVDYACVDQEDIMPGVNALPMILAQCDVLISLTDDQYLTRAWCCVEVLMVQVLKRSYNLHKWYEQVLAEPSEGTDGDVKQWMLRDGPMDLEIDVKDKLLSSEEDRPKILFLERQSKLLG